MKGLTPHHTSASAGGVLNHGGTLIPDASGVDDNTAAGGRRPGITGDNGGMGTGIPVVSTTKPEATLGPGLIFMR